ncbi:phycobilisome linker polypeptide [Oculatella sp. LEGE 06141]|uniref:phycobilisome linker polypeptide n=1 Tax=Oculatella sp. LEGE 06141 TaxID=1828648 RepID=UPI001882FCE9|nr:phycobilisome linker polypeptide [Oculatella sp. LEGE 06141]MBE9182140.1 phycobilisome linker polypeptide [Oculatella sp. LEGE 06141]
MSSNASFSSISQDATPNACLGGSWTESSRVYRLEVTGVCQPGYPSVRHSSTAFLVPFEQMLPRMQQIHRMGGKITSITPAS